MTAIKLLNDLKLGLVGCGKIARDQHLPAIAAIPGLSVVAIVDPVVIHESLPTYPDVATMIAAHPEIAAITLCQPPQARFEPARDAIRAGRHVFLEKPAAATLCEAEALIDMARVAGVTLFAAWHSREAAAVAEAKRWVRSQTLRSVEIVWKEDVRVWHPGQKWLSQPGGFGILDTGINAFSVLTEVLPDPVRVISADLEVPADWQTPIAARLEMATLSGLPITADMDFRQAGPQHWDIRFSTDANCLLLSDGGNSLSIDGVAQACSPQQEYLRLYRRFAELVQSGQSDSDLAPLRLAADTFLRSRMSATESFAY